MSVEAFSRITALRRRYHVDSASAHRIAAMFMAADSAPTDPVVRRAYAELSEQAQQLFTRMTGASNQLAVRVRFTRESDPYANAAELADSVRRYGVLEVGLAAQDSRRHPLLCNFPGGAHDQFRAVHDLVSHYLLGNDFSRDGEFSSWLAEDQLYRGLARWALATELHAQHSVRWTTGHVAPFKAVLLPQKALEASASSARLVGQPRRCGSTSRCPARCVRRS